LKPGCSVQLVINDIVLSTGYIDSVTCTAQRGSGLEYHIEGRDKLAQAVDACADPTKSFKGEQSLTSALKELFAPFGWDSEEDFVLDAAAYEQLKTNKYRQKTQKSDAKGFGRGALKRYKAHQLRPHMRESVFEFASRLTQRRGLHLWSSADGEVLFAAAPDFAQLPTFFLARNREGGTNVLSGSVKFALMDQPSHIIADGYAGTGEFGKSRMVVIMFNNAVSLGSLPAPPDVKKYEAAGAKYIEGPVFPFKLPVLRRARAIYLHDDESTTVEQLEAFVRREMANYQRRSLEVSYEVEGHGQLIDGAFVPWTINTVVKVKDQPADLDEDLWVMGVHYKKSRGGTTTSLELIRLNTLVFSDTDQKIRK
jgi:prophage tail gpP-like protein